MTTLVWFRRDLRVKDQPTFLRAKENGKDAVGVFVLDPTLLGNAGKPRKEYLFAALAELDNELSGKLLVVEGDPVTAIPKIASKVKASKVVAAEDFMPYGRRRDDQVAAKLDIDFDRIGSPYAVSPGNVINGSGNPYKVFTPFHRAWLDRGWHSPAKTTATTLNWVAADVEGVTLPASERPSGESEAWKAWRKFKKNHLDGYDTNRNRPDLDVTSRMSPHLKFGTIHPRSILSEIDRRSKDERSYVMEVSWREFYADYVYNNPRSLWHNVNDKFDNFVWNDSREDFALWQEGKTGFPIVDAGMRQLLEEGWMHNRVRMIVASFLTKDLHLPWQWGARHFMNHLVDGDISSNNHGWQWTAGTGTDASPYFRVFNPSTQGDRFDPDERYRRRWIPELGTDQYPSPMVDHSEERDEALRRYEQVK